MFLLLLVALSPPGSPRIRFTATKGAGDRETQGKKEHSTECPTPIVFSSKEGALLVPALTFKPQHLAAAPACRQEEGS